VHVFYALDTLCLKNENDKMREKPHLSQTLTKGCKMTNPKNHCIVGVHITDRVRHVPAVQEIFTKFGCFIKTRIGLHDMGDNSCSPNGLIIVELLGDKGKSHEFISELAAIEGVDVQHMVFTH